MAVMTKEEHEAAITALYAQLEALRESPVEEYEASNGGQRNAVKYRKPSEITAQIEFHRRAIARMSKSRALPVFRRGA